MNLVNSTCCFFSFKLHVQTKKTNFGCNRTRGEKRYRKTNYWTALHRQRGEKWTFFYRLPFSKPHHVGGIVSFEENHRRGTISRNTGTQATLGASVNGYRACLDTGYRGSLTAAGNHSSLLFVSGKRVERELSADHVNDHRQRTLAVSWSSQFLPPFVLFPWRDIRVTRRRGGKKVDSRSFPGV